MICCNGIGYCHSETQYEQFGKRRICWSSNGQRSRPWQTTLRSGIAVSSLDLSRGPWSGPRTLPDLQGPADVFFCTLSRAQTSHVVVETLNVLPPIFLRRGVHRNIARLSVPNLRSENPKGSGGTRTVRHGGGRA